MLLPAPARPQPGITPEAPTMGTLDHGAGVITPFGADVRRVAFRDAFLLAKPEYHVSLGW